MAGQKKREPEKTGDPVADAILEWWQDQEGPHMIPVFASHGKALKLAALLRRKGLVKEK